MVALQTIPVSFKGKYLCSTTYPGHMSEKNETLTFTLALFITVSLVGGIFWLFTRSYFFKNSIFQLSDRQNIARFSPSYITFVQVKNVPSGLFSYGGSTTWAPIRQKIDSGIQTVWPKFQLRYTDPISGTPGSGRGITMLLDNQLAFSQSSRSLKEEEYQEAAQKGFSLKEIPIAIDGIAVAVNPNLNVPGLTVEQLKDIYTGIITNWNQIGGPNISITPYSRKREDGGTVDFFANNVLEEEDFSENVQFVYSTTPALRKVADNIGAIYYASAPEVVPQCTVKALPIGRSKQDNLVSPYQQPFVPLNQCGDRRNQVDRLAFQTGEYPLTRRLFVIVKENGQDDEKAGFAYANLLLTNQGQDLISEAGFVRIK